VGEFSHNEFSLVCIQWGKATMTGRLVARSRLEIAQGDRESDRSGLAIGLFVRGAQGRCESLSTTQRSEQHDWMQL
jgi:hypothetical protein